MVEMMAKMMEGMDVTELMPQCLRMLLPSWTFITRRRATGG